MLREFFTRAGIRRFLSRIRVGGFGVNEILRDDSRNTQAAFLSRFRQAVRADMPVETAIREFGAVARSRRNHALRKLKNIMVAVRGQARAVIAGRRNGRWFNRAIFDENITDTCASFIGATWDVPYSEIERKPPRTPPIHPCRSWLQFVPDGDPEPDERPFIQQFNEDEDAQLGLLGRTKFEAFRAGELEINSFAQFERIRLTRVDELNL